METAGATGLCFGSPSPSGHKFEYSLVIGTVPHAPRSPHVWIDSFLALLERVLGVKQCNRNFHSACGTACRSPREAPAVFIRLYSFN